MEIILFPFSLVWLVCNSKNISAGIENIFQSNLLKKLSKLYESHKNLCAELVWNTLSSPLFSELRVIFSIYFDTWTLFKLLAGDVSVVSIGIYRISVLNILILFNQPVTIWVHLWLSWLVILEQCICYYSLLLSTRLWTLCKKPSANKHIQSLGGNAGRMV